MITLPSLKDGLPIIRQAFTTGELQMCKDGDWKICLYAGPCAVGAIMSPEDRLRADEEGGTITLLVEYSLMEVENEEELEDYIQLQIAHDAAVISYINDSFLNEAYLSKVARFDVLLTQLEEKYNV